MIFLRLGSRPGPLPSALAAVLLVIISLGGRGARAEPAFAVRTGYRCSQCHFNRTGGGLRNSFGSLYLQTVLPQRQLHWREGGNLLPADPDARFTIGADGRFQWLNIAPPRGARVSSLEIPEANIYAEGRLVPGWLSVYLDAKGGPGGASARELFALLSAQKWNAYLKAGKFLLPFGWRLPDDSAYIRQFTSFSYLTPDIGLEMGIEPGRWSAHLAITNGTAGGSENNRSKQFSFLGVRRFSIWRVGLSGSNNIGSGVRTTQAGLLGGANFGRLTLLGELDGREEHGRLAPAEGMTAGPVEVATRHQLIALLEADLLVSRGIDIKFTHDWIDPDRNVRTDSRVRDSVGVEYIPYPFLQLRVFYRRSDGPPPSVTGFEGSRNKQVDLEAHMFF